MFTETELKKAFDKAVHSFLLKEIKQKSLAEKIATPAQVKVFDKGSKLVVEREGAPPLEIEPKEHTSKELIRKEYILQSDFDMVRAFFVSLATKMADQETEAIIEELKTHAGTKVDAKGDFLGGLIKGVQQMKKKGYTPDTIIVNPEDLKKLDIALKKDPERARMLKKLLSKEEQR